MSVRNGPSGRSSKHSRSRHSDGAGVGRPLGAGVGADVGAGVGGVDGSGVGAGVGENVDTVTESTLASSIPVVSRRRLAATATSIAASNAPEEMDAVTTSVT